jgi:hypothetical protein
MAIFSQDNNLAPTINNVVIVWHQQQAGKPMKMKLFYYFLSFKVFPYF